MASPPNTTSNAVSSAGNGGLLLKDLSMFRRITTSRPASFWCRSCRGAAADEGPADRIPGYDVSFGSRGSHGSIPREDCVSY
jgi:hypothetical protein